MKVEIDKGDARIVSALLGEVLAEWRNKTSEMQSDKKCPLEIYEEHIDSCKKLDTILETIKEQL